MAVRTMLLNGRLFDSVSGGIVEHASILINGERVETVSAGEMAAPEGVEVVDFGGQTVVPGLIDTHVHYALDGDEALKLFVATGVTSVRGLWWTTGIAEARSEGDYVGREARTAALRL